MRALTRRKDGSDHALESFLSLLDPRGDTEQSQAFQFAAAVSHERRFKEFMNRLYRPRYARASLGAIARSCDLTLGDFMVFWRRAQLDRAIDIASLAALRIVDEMAEDALPKEVLCARCDGLGWVEIAAWVPPNSSPATLARFLTTLKADIVAPARPAGAPV